MTSNTKLPIRLIKKIFTYLPPRKVTDCYRNRFLTPIVIPIIRNGKSKVYKNFINNFNRGVFYDLNNIALLIQRNILISCKYNTRFIDVFIQLNKNLNVFYILEVGGKRKCRYTLLELIVRYNKYLNLDRYIELLIKKGANVNFCHHNATPLLNACWWFSASKPGTVQQLINLGANVNKLYNQKGNVLMKICAKPSNNDQKLVEILVKNGIDLSHRDKNGDTALTIVIEKSSLSPKLITRPLIKAISKDPKCEAIVNTQNNKGASALMLACHHSRKYKKKKHLKYIIKSLLGLGIDPNLQDKKGRTALMLLYDYKNKIVDDKIIDMLIYGGADLTIKDNKGKTAMMYSHIPVENKNKLDEESKEPEERDPTITQWLFDSIVGMTFGESKEKLS